MGNSKGNPLTRHLDTLQDARLIRVAQMTPEIEYLFHHTLIQEAAYLSLLKADRRNLHQAVGEVLQKLHGERLDDIAATLAYHFERAEAHAQALRYFERAADRARATYANDEAIAFYRAAIEQARRLLRADAPSAADWIAQLAQLYERLGDVLEATGRLAEARTAYDDALQSAPQADPIAQARLRRKEASAWGFEFDRRDAAYALAMQALGAEPNEPAAAWWQEWLTIRLDQMRSLYWQGAWREIARLVEQTQPILQQYGTPTLRFYFFDSLISIDERSNRYVISDAVIRHTRAMLAAAHESGELRLIGEGHFQMGFCLLMHGDFDEAEAQLNTAEEIMRRTGNAPYLAFVLTYRSLLHRRRKQPDTARTVIVEAHAATKTLNLIPHLAVAEGNLAWLCWREQKMGDARRHGLAALALWSQSSFVYPFQWTAYLPLMAVALHDGQTAEAIGYGRALCEPTQQRLPDALDAPLAQAVERFEQGQVEQARVWLEGAVAAAGQRGYL